VIATDTHIVMVPSPGGPVPTPLPSPFAGILSGDLSPDVLIEKKPAAVNGSTADNTPPHIPTPPGVSFQKQPSNKAKIIMGSQKVLINNKEAAHAGDTAETCNDPADMPVGQVIAVGTVLIGD